MRGALIKIYIEHAASDCVNHIVTQEGGGKCLQDTHVDLLCHATRHALGKFVDISAALCCSGIDSDTPNSTPIL